MYFKQKKTIKYLLKKRNKRNKSTFFLFRKKKISWKKLRSKQKRRTKLGLAIQKEKTLLAGQVKSAEKIEEKKKRKKTKKKDLYKKFFKKARKKFHFTNLYLLKAFLTRRGKIKSRKRTKLTIFQQKKISNLIQKARHFGLIPFIKPVTKKLKTKWEKRKEKREQRRQKEKQKRYEKRQEDKRKKNLLKFFGTQNKKQFTS